MNKTLVLFAALALSAAATSSLNAQIVTWTATSAPVQSTLAGGPWTLSQGPDPTTTYCTAGGTGVPIVNPASTVNTMNPFYFPFVTGSGNNLQGYFDYRPDSIDEAIVGASSTDGGKTWTFQQQVASLTSDCPTSNPAAGNDDGEGHPHTLSFLGTTWLYLLDRRNDYVDSAGLIVQRLTPNIPAGQPLKPVAAGTSFTPPASLPPGASLFAGWDFNNDSNGTVKYNGNSYSVNNAPAPSIGAGTAIPLGMTNNFNFPVGGSTGTLTGSVANADITTTEGSTDPGLDFTSNSWRVRGPACTKSNANCGANVGNGWNTAAAQYTQGAEFDVPTTGQYHVVFQYDWYVTAQGFRDLQAQYNININNANGWTNVGPLQVTPDGGGFVNQITVDFTALGITGVDNNPNFGVRLVGAYDPTFTGPGTPCPSTPCTYTGATLTNGLPMVYNNNSGNWRFDEVNFFGNSSSSTTTSPIATVTPSRTVGLLEPDGILAVVPGTYPVKVLYIQKQLEGDYSFPTVQQCNNPPVVPPFYPFSLTANHDISTVRLATTTNGVNFTDLGPVNGLNDSTTVSYVGIRYVSPNGGLVPLPGGKWGLFFGAGNCIDADSDSFHAIAYAESSDLVNWTIYNGINNPIVSRPTATFTDQATGAMLTIPAIAPVVAADQAANGFSYPWYAGRVYAPNAIVNSTGSGVSLIFDGYDQGYAAKGAAKDLSSYRNVGQVFLSSGGVVLP